MAKKLTEALTGVRSAAATARGSKEGARGTNAESWARARALRDAGRYGASLLEWSRLAEGDAGDPRPWIERARLLSRWERHREAAAAASMATSLGMRDPADIADTAAIL